MSGKRLLDEGENDGRRDHARDVQRLCFFFVPKDIAGRTVVFEGEAQKTLVPVEHLKHYAQDAGKNNEEIVKITEPKPDLTFIADGVILK
jgi:hypothetical protein